MINTVFVYGTLMPGQPRWPALRDVTTGSPIRDTVTGTLLDTGAGYPALLLDSRCPVVHGWRVQITPAAVPATLARLDQIEGTDSGLYQRVVVHTAAGVACWTYEYLMATAGMTDLHGQWSLPANAANDNQIGSASATSTPRGQSSGAAQR